MGGVREKALAALRAGITRVILPRKNLMDLKDLPRELKRQITLIPVDHMSEVLEAALEPSPDSKRSNQPESSQCGSSRAPLASAKS